MDRNRKILLSILALLVLAVVLAIIDISLTMQSPSRRVRSISSSSIAPGVGVVRISGPIEFAGPADNPFMPRQGAESVLKRLDELMADSRIKAIVVRINSPGGTVAATQEIFQKLMKARKGNMVLVASMGDVAASGGYYAASACGFIMANPGTLTGSIGVIAVSPNLKGLFEKLGIRMTVIKSGRYKDLLSSFRDLGEDERLLIQQMIDSTYKRFLKDVSLGRNVPISDIEPVADGRVMTGEAALGAKLIDGIGGFEEALEKARKMAKLPDDAPVYDDVRSPIEQLFMSVEGAIGRRPALHDMVPLPKHHLLEYRFLP